MKILLVYLTCIFFTISCGNQSELDVFSSLEEGIADATIKRNNILLVFDFLGNPNKSPIELFYEKEIHAEIKKITLVILNVDEPGEKGKTNKEIQMKRFGTKSQPTCYILNKNGEIIKGPLGYTSKSRILEFLK